MRRFRLRPNGFDKRGRDAWLTEGEVYDGVVLERSRVGSPAVRLFRRGTEEWTEVPMERLTEVTEENNPT
jgi:hypothetical protein